MRELLKSDLRRILKDKLFLAACILGVIFAAITPLTNKLLVVALDINGDTMSLSSFAQSKDMFFSAFSLGGNFGLILPILISIILCKDFSHGTVRNKIICGKSRSQIFLSSFFSGTIVICAAMLAHALITLMISLLFFPYQADPFTASSFLYLLISLLFSLLLYVFVSAIISALSVLMKNTGLAVVLFVAINFFFTIIGTVTTVASIFINPEDSTTVKIFEILQKANPFLGAVIGRGTSYSLTDVLCILIPVVAGTALCIALGLTVFKKKDLK